MKTSSLKGLSLVEMLVVLAILSIIVTLSLSVVYNAQRTQRRIDDKYDCAMEVNRITKEVETSLRLAQRLVLGTDRSIKFLNINNDTNEYYLTNDTLFNNEKSVTNLQIDSLFFVYIKIKENEEVADFYFFDENRDGYLDTLELNDVSALHIYIDFLCPQASGTKPLVMQKQLFISFRNLQID